MCWISDLNFSKLMLSASDNMTSIITPWSSSWDLSTCQTELSMVCYWWLITRIGVLNASTLFSLPKILFCAEVRKQNLARWIGVFIYFQNNNKIKQLFSYWSLILQSINHSMLKHFKNRLFNSESVHLPWLTITGNILCL